MGCLLGEIWHTFPQYVVIPGEMSEVQKQQIEKYRMEAKGKEAELIELRQQMCKLTEIIDKQKTEIRELTGEIRWVSWSFHMEQHFMVN